MNPIKSRPWYKKKRYLIPIGTVAGLISIGSFGSNNTPSSVQNTQYTVPVAQQQQTVTSVSAKEISPTKVQTTNTTNLSNDNSYTNTAGNEVHSPAYTEDNSIPAGASARCRDGTYSFSQSRRGTCSHHGGVGEWL
jgi:hypothetical protein